MTSHAPAIALPFSSVPRSDTWAKVAAFLVVGYLGLGKPFAYLGLPWISLYVGEIALAAFLFFGPVTKLGPWVSVLWRFLQLQRFKRLLLLSLAYGGFQALRGAIHGYPLFAAIRDTAFNYYPLFLFLGIWVGVTDAQFSKRVMRLLALWAGLYGLLWILFLNRMTWTVPGTDDRVLLFMVPQGASMVALLGLVAFEPNLRSAWKLILLNTFVLLGVQGRSEWLGLAVALALFALLTGKIKQLVVGSALMILVLCLMFVSGLDIATPTGRGEGAGATLSATSLIARALAPLNKNLAADVGPTEEVNFATDTTEWRLVWWANIWFEVHTQLTTELLGFGYGYPVGDLNPDIEPGTFIQTPHNAALYALVFSGWLGVGLFVLLQAELCRLLWESFRITRQPFPLMCWAAFLMMAMFGDFFEAPFGAIPFYLLVGAGITPALLQVKQRSPKRLRAPLLASPGAQGA